MPVSDSALLYVGTIEEIEAEKDEEVTLFGPNPEALAELANADWQKKRAPRFDEADVPSCHGHPNPDLWFSDEREDRTEAAAICLTCPVRVSCDTQTLTETHGTWAGRQRGKGVGGRPAAAGPCPSGHDEWVVRANGSRECRACGRERKRAKRAVVAA